ncbi:hypothetical protein CDAR_417341 [Caerostris darwini]|uniref:Uncharacterized protein n=1 Tax=Caerostris darwini TaxID=1538125 RepID=A0AAV4X719_9ARAC|nr:hypothetical protein CDAR_417341 [Caerostris darwini]
MSRDSTTVSSRIRHSASIATRSPSASTPLTWVTLSDGDHIYSSAECEGGGSWFLSRLLAQIVSKNVLLPVKNGTLAGNELH